MKLIRPNDTTLVAVEKNTTILFIGLVFFLVGLLPIIFLKPSGSWLNFYGGFGVFSAIGLFVALVRKSIKLTLDKSSGQATLDISSILGHKSFTYPFNQINKVHFSTDLRTSSSSDGRSTSETYRLFLLMNDGTTVQLSDQQRQMGLTNVFGQIPNFKEGQAIAEFIGVPFEQAGPPDIAQTIKTVVQTAVETAENKPGQVEAQKEL